MDDAILREVIGYLNFSNGQPDAGFQRNLNRLFESFESERPLPALRRLLLDRLAMLKDESETFADSQQAVAVTKLVCDECVPAYQRHHADLLFHLSDEAFEQPFFIARVFEATLAQRPPWDETERIVSGALEQLNDFIGYRPFAVLENGRQMQPYPHERFGPVPLYLRDAGVACGVYHDLVELTIECLKEMPDEILHEAHFDLTRMNELALDVRAHDHTHPVNKRTNYMFGEWDPHLIDTKGF